MNDKLVICIPGQWKDREKLSRYVQKKSRSEYVLAEDLLMDVKRNRAFEVQFQERDAELSEAFYYADRGIMNDKMLQKLDKHTHVLYLKSYMGSLESVQRIVPAVQLLLKSGGLAVSIQNSGKAFTPEEWGKLTDEARLDQLLHTFVSYRQNEQYYYSCGMQMLGLPEAAISIDTDPDASMQVMSQFLYSLMAHEEDDSNQETEFKLYGRTYSSQHYIECFNEEEPNFYNPHGMYILTEVM